MRLKIIKLMIIFDEVKRYAKSFLFENDNSCKIETKNYGLENKN
jgi:hypothetical protein